MRRRGAPILCLGVLSLVAAACANVDASTAARGNTPPVSHVYVAIGESGSTGLRSGSDLRATWPRMFYQSALGSAGTFYDFSMSGETVADALHTVLPEAEAVKPDLVSVWVSTADIAVGTNPSTYGRELGQLVGSLRQGGATVLLANAAPAALILAFAGCADRGQSCGAAAPALPTPAVLADSVVAYDDVISAVARTTGALVVDVQGVLSRALAGGGRASVVSPDDPSLSSAGAALVARAFQGRLPKRFTAARR